ncbi:MAG: ribose 5-phosphate isomerase B [Saprospiraceae bacterium]|nr:ribose 5-phosphate isomerase B [Saprospiraceae bacterium]
MSTKSRVSKDNGKIHVAIGCDHAGFPYKEAIKQMLKEEGYAILDMGTDSLESVDYPDFVHPVATAMEKGEASHGVLICGSGNGVAMTANKHQTIRAAVCWNTELASLARHHNNANVIAIPARFIDESEAVQVVRVFVHEDFDGGRHSRRVNKISIC